MYGHVLQIEDNVWVKKFTEYEVEGAKTRGRANLERDCGKRLSGMYIEQGAMDRKRWRKQIRDDR